MKGIILAVNSCGGMVPLDSVKVLAEIEKEKMIWPGDDFDEEEIITISRWPKARHYYLSSNKDRVFTPARYTSYKAARQIAEHYTNLIETKENTGSLPNFQ